MKTITNIIYPAFALFAFACFALSPTAQAVSPAPDGGYSGQNTAEGENALFNLSPTDGSFNTAVGWVSLFSNITGSLNTGVGAATLWANRSHNNTAVGAGALALNTTGDGNTANGALALLQNTVGRGNTAVGAAALFFNDGDPSIENSGSGNTAVGAAALNMNTVGFGNTGVGAQALQNNTTAPGNTAVGGQALFSNTVGSGNTAVGARALFNNIGGGQTEGVLNTAVGLEALTANTTGAFNTAVGAGLNGSPVPAPAALGSNTTGAGNTAVGARSTLGPAALGSNTTGNENTAVGQNALAQNTSGGSNTAIGGSALARLGKGGPSPSPSPTPGNYNIALGADAGSNLITGSDNIYIGNNGGMEAESNTIRIGDPGPPPTGQNRTFIAGISGVGVTGAAVFVNTDHQLGVMTSSARFKDEIQPMDKASNAILALKPVTFRYKKGIDPQRIPQFGLVAEEVEKVNADLVVRDKAGKPYSVRYEAVNAMLLNEFLKEHKTVEDLKSAAAKQEATIASQQKQIEALTTGLQKVSAQLEASKPAPQVVNNP